jgi:adenylate cyclase
VALAAVKLFFDWDFDAAYHSLQKAISLTPGAPEAHHLYALYLTAVGDHEEAVEAMRTALQLDPLSAVFNDALALALTRAGRPTQAREQIERTLELHPHFRPAIETLGWCHAFEGEYERAITEFERLPAEAGHAYAGVGDRGYAYARAGRLDDARRMLELLEQRGSERPDLTLDFDFALVYEGLGEREKVLEHLARAIDRRMGTVVLLGSFVAFADARSDPRFQALLDRIGLPRVAAA